MMWSDGGTGRAVAVSRSLEDGGTTKRGVCSEERLHVKDRGSARVRNLVEVSD